MVDSSLSSLGAKVVVVSSSDENHPLENIIDGDTKTFWMSTGMFPQEFIIRFNEPTRISSVTVDSYNVKHLKIEKNTSQMVSQFEPVTDQEFEHTKGHLQSNTVSPIGIIASHLRFIITSGYDHFVSVHRNSRFTHGITKGTDLMVSRPTGESLKAQFYSHKETPVLISITHTQAPVSFHGHFYVCSNGFCFVRRPFGTLYSITLLTVEELRDLLRLYLHYLGLNAGLQNKPIKYEIND